jgi:hypothetical protein
VASNWFLGLDLDTDVFDAEKREANLGLLKGVFLPFRT